MFEKFTDRARRIMALASQAAQEWNHEYIGTEHILIGVVKEGTGVGSNILQKFGMNVDKLEKTMKSLLTSGPEMVTMGKLPQTPSSKKVIEFAIENARRMNHNAIGTEHILLGLLDVDEGFAHDALIRYSITKDLVQQEVNHLLGLDDGEESGCLVCDKFDMCIFAQKINQSDENMLQVLFGHWADEIMAEVFKFCGKKCMKYERVDE